jgi:hypothetical protein
MSKIKIQGNASGTGVVTLTAPNTNTDRTITLPDGDISLGVGIADNATSTAITIDVSGNTTVNTGNLVIGTSGKGIDFSATANGSGTTTSEVLDDYETGTWTPSFIAGASDATYDIQVGSYTKIGNKVHVQGRLKVTALGTMSGNLLIQGLPFTSSATAQNMSTAHIGYGWGLAITAGTTPTGFIDPNGTKISLMIWSSVFGIETFTTTTLSADGTLMFSADYIT